MITYFCVFSIVWACAFAEFVSRNRKVYPFAITSAGLFIALRLETGNDWLTYARIHQEIPSLFVPEISEIFFIAVEQQKEFLFVLLNSVSKTIWDSYISIQIIASGMYFYALNQLLRIVPTHRALVFALTFSWLCFTLMMSAVSQSLAVAVFYMFLVTRQRHGRKRAALAVTAIAFQVSAGLYFAVYYAARLTVGKLTMTAALLIFYALALLSISPASFVIEIFISISPGWISSKLSYYLNDRGLEGNIFDFYFIRALAGATVLWLIFSYDHFQKADGVVYILFKMIFFATVFQLVFIEQTVFRYRMLYMIFPVLFLLAASRLTTVNIVQRLVLFSGLLTVSGTYFALYLGKELSIAFLPYQNVIVSALFDIPSTGFERYIDMLLMIREGRQ